MKRASTLYQRASADAIRNGLEWYPATRLWCREMAERYGVGIDTTAAILAVLSQRKRWRENKLAAVQALKGTPYAAMGQMRRKVQRLLNGENPAHVVTGPKIRSFWKAIMGDQDAVVLDVWMLKAYGETKKTLTPKQYERLADRLRRDAKRLGIAPSVYQATVWVEIRGAHN